MRLRDLEHNERIEYVRASSKDGANFLYGGVKP